MQEDAKGIAGGALQGPEKTAQVAAAIDDPCDEGGYDQFCRDDRGTLCQFYIEHCHAPDYPCLDHLRHHLAVDFLKQIVQRRKTEALLAGAPPANDSVPLGRR